MSGREGPTETREGRARKKSAIQRIRHRVAKRSHEEVIAFERRLLAGATVGVALSLVLWSVAVSTDYWFHVAPEAGLPLYINRTDAYFVRSHSGLWTICKFVRLNGSIDGPDVRKCHNHRLFPSDEFIQKNTEVDRTILDYTRTETAFAIITFCLLVMGLSFSVYTFKEPRYMFKRLAGGVHFITAGAILVVIEVVVNSVEYEEQYLNDRHPHGATWSYGYSFAVAWVTFALQVVIGLTFMICSRKRKGDRSGALGGGDDEPNILGRL